MTASIKRRKYDHKLYKASSNLESLKSFSIKENLPNYIDMINSGEKSTVDALYELTEKEMDLKEKRAIKACVQTAEIPFEKTINDFDFSFQPSINKGEIEDYTTLRFMENNENILFIGSSGTGKTHLAISNGMKRAESENRLDQRLKFFTRQNLLKIDEIGYINLDKEDANLFFQLISRRYEQQSTIITTNKNQSKWSTIFGDSVIANAILDRLLHHSHIGSIVGPSYRIKDVMDSFES